MCGGRGPVRLPTGVLLPLLKTQKHDTTATAGRTQYYTHMLGSNTHTTLRTKLYNSKPSLQKQFAATTSIYKAIKTCVCTNIYARRFTCNTCDGGCGMIGWFFEVLGRYVAT